MGNYAKVMRRILEGTNDSNIAFQDLRQVLARLGFAERIRGDHHIFGREDVAEIINIQPKGAKAKPYQVKQVRGIILRYKLGDSTLDSL